MRRAMTVFYVLGLTVLIVGLFAQYAVIKQQKAEVEDLRAVATEQMARAIKLEAELVEAKDAIKEYTAIASWYGPGFHGRRAADGSIYDQAAYTIAHKTLPFGTIVVLEYKGRRVPAVVTDRGPYIEGRDFDLSLGLAKRLGLVAKGVDEIKVYQIDVVR